MPPRYEREGVVSGPVVKGYVGAGYRIDDRVHDGGVLLSPLWARPWAPGDPGALAVDDIAELMALDPLPEFILLGTGPTLRRPPGAFVGALEAKGVGVEPMDSRAAARAWAVLRAEDRWIAAALLPHQ